MDTRVIAISIAVSHFGIWGRGTFSPFNAGRPKIWRRGRDFPPPFSGMAICAIAGANFFLTLGLF